MRFARLTNLGFLTIKNLDDIDKDYKENADEKRKKLKKLWTPEYSMEFFYRTFARKDTPPYPFLSVSEKQDRFKTRLLENLENMGLVSFQDADLVHDISRKIFHEENTHPIHKLNNVFIELTGLCNLKCKHCYRGGSRADEYGLPVETIKQALNPLLRAGIKHISITGGEPTVRRQDLIEIIEYASQFLILKDTSIEKKMLYKYGKIDPTIEDVLQDEHYKKLRKKLIGQLSWSEEQLIPGDWRIFNKHTPEDVEKFLRERASWNLEYQRQPSTVDLDSIGVLSNGCFEAPEEFLRKLQSYGNVSLQLSLDSFNGHTTNENRGEKGLFGKLKNLVSIGNSIDYPLYFTGHNIGGANTSTEKRNERYFDRNSRVLVLPGMLQLGNTISSGYKPGDRRKSGHLGELSRQGKKGEGWCTGWTSPTDIHIKPSGIVGNCLYSYAVPEEFGDLNSQKMEDILNGIQNTRVFEMFNDGTIESAQYELNKRIFNRKYNSSCELIALTLTYAMIKERLVREGVENPIEQANQEVARIYKFDSGREVK